MLYLIKASRIREYHQQNLAILGAPEGERVSISYSPRWVQPGLVVKPGDGCVIVFADSPYESFVPVRFGVIARADRPDDRLDVEVRLGAFVRSGAREALRELWSRFDRDDDSRPGRVFALEDDNPGILSPQSIDERDDSWRHVVDGLADNGYFDRSTMARIRRVTDSRGVDLGEKGVAVGESVHVEIEMRTPSADRVELGFLLDTSPEGSLLVDESVALPSTGTQVLEITPTVPGVIDAQIDLLPEPLLSSSPTFSVIVSDSAKETAPTSPAPLPAQLGSMEIRTLITRLRRDAQMSSDTWFALYEDLLLPLAADEPAVVSAFAEVAYETSRFDRCVTALRDLGDRRRPDDDLRLLLASLRSGTPIELESVLERLDFSSNKDFEALLKILDEVDSSMLQELTVALSDNVLGEDKLLRFLDKTFIRLPSIDRALEVAERAAYADPDRGADLLLRRWPDADAAPEKAVHHLIEWGARTERLQPYFERAIHIAESRSDWATLEELAATVRRLSGARSRSPLLILIGNALLVSDDPRCSDAGFALLVEVTREAAVQGELELAVRIAERLLGYASLRGEPELRSTANDLRDAVKQALDASRELDEWRKMQDDRRAEELAARFRGKNLHIVGGKAEPWAKTLEESVGFNEVRWHETEKKGSNNTDWADSLTADRDVVLVMWEQIGHAVSGAVKDKCSRRGVPRTESSCSIRDVMDELAKLGST